MKSSGARLVGRMWGAAPETSERYPSLLQEAGLGGLTSASREG
jgi:hypothetical protein